MSLWVSLIESIIVQGLKQLQKYFKQILESISVVKALVCLKWITFNLLLDQIFTLLYKFILLGT